MIVIFLDIDGVMRTHESDLKWSEELGYCIPPLYRRHLSKESMENLNYIVRLTGAKVVITSTWRCYYSIGDMISIFKKYGFIGDIIDYTRRFDTRGEEIIDWLNSNRVTNYVVVDDNIKDIVNRIPFTKIVKCESKKGLDCLAFEEILDIIG